MRHLVSKVDDGPLPGPAVYGGPGPTTHEQGAARFKRSCHRFIKIDVCW